MTNDDVIVTKQSAQISLPPSVANRSWIRGCSPRGLLALSYLWRGWKRKESKSCLDSNSSWRFAECSHGAESEHTAAIETFLWIRLRVANLSNHDALGFENLTLLLMRYHLLFFLIFFVDRFCFLCGSTEVLAVSKRSHRRAEPRGRYSHRHEHCRAHCQRCSLEGLLFYTLR